MARGSVRPVAPELTWPPFQSAQLHRGSVGRVFGRARYTGVHPAGVQSAKEPRSSVGPVFSRPRYTGVHLSRGPGGTVTPVFSGSFSPPSYPESVRHLGVHLAGVQTAQLHRGSLGPVFGRARYTGVHPAGVQSAKEPRGSVGPVFSRPRYTGVHLSRGPGGPV